MGIHPTCPFALGFVSDVLCWKLGSVPPIGKAFVHPWQARGCPSVRLKPCQALGMAVGVQAAVSYDGRPVPLGRARRGDGHLHPDGSALRLSSLSQANLPPASKDLRLSPGKRQRTTFWDATGRSAKATCVWRWKLPPQRRARKFLCEYKVR